MRPDALVCDAVPYLFLDRWMRPEEFAIFLKMKLAIINRLLLFCIWKWQRQLHYRDTSASRDTYRCRCRCCANWIGISQSNQFLMNRRPPSHISVRNLIFVLRCRTTIVACAKVLNDNIIINFIWLEWSGFAVNAFRSVPFFRLSVEMSFCFFLPNYINMIWSSLSFFIVIIASIARSAGVRCVPINFAVLAACANVSMAYVPENIIIIMYWLHSLV